MTRIKHHKEPWRIVVGPFGAAACYLKALGWKASSLTKWQAGEEKFDLLDRGSMHLLSLRLKKTCDQWRWKALACGENGQTLQEGIEWQAPRKALKQCKGVKNKALVASGKEQSGMAKGPGVPGATRKPPYNMCCGSVVGGKAT